MNKKIFDIPITYLLGGALIFVYLAFCFFINDAFDSYNTYLVFLVLFIIGFPLIIYGLAKFNKNLSLGFMIGILNIILFVALYLIEIAIHPPSEE